MLIIDLLVVANHVECDLVCLTNLGETQVFSLPHLKRIFTADCIRRENIMLVVDDTLNYCT